jgi:hypothetical protein
MVSATTTAGSSASDLIASASTPSSQQAPASAEERVCPPENENDLSSLLREYRQLQYRIDVAQRTIRNLAAIFGKQS